VIAASSNAILTAIVSGIKDSVFVPAVT